ncbi:MAG: hypothetical protein ABIR36_01940, partial [Nitrospiraceae bacterium]
MATLVAVAAECCSSALYDSPRKLASCRYDSLGIAIASVGSNRVGAGLLSLKEEYKGHCGGERELDKEGLMQCTRCDGLMVADSLIDMQESSIPMWM